jgi:hypothetical protein
MWLVARQRTAAAAAVWCCARRIDCMWKHKQPFTLPVHAASRTAGQCGYECHVESSRRLPDAHAGRSTAPHNLHMQQLHPLTPLCPFCCCC